MQQKDKIHQREGTNKTMGFGSMAPGQLHGRGRIGIKQKIGVGLH